MSTLKKNEAAFLTAEEAALQYESTPVDIAIIGGGPAGYSAAINGLTRGRTVVILSGDYRASYLYRASELNNIPGMPGRSGAEVLDLYHNHAVSMGAIIIEGRALVILPFTYQTAAGVNTTGYQIAYGNHILQARTVILATGASVATPYPGEEKYIGRGISYCATCDGMLFRGRSVAVIAKTAEAVEEALHLVRIGCKVHLFISPSDVKRWDVTIPAGQFESVTNGSAYRIEGDDNTVTTLFYADQSVAVACVFILRASIAPSALLSGLALDGTYMITDKSQATNIPGVYAAGDCAGKPLQVAKALGEGLVAALSADAYITKIDAETSEEGNRI